jgi:hypothetical protein
VAQEAPAGLEDKDKATRTVGLVTNGSISYHSGGGKRYLLRMVKKPL